MVCFILLVAQYVDFGCFIAAFFIFILLRYIAILQDLVTVVPIAIHVKAIRPPDVAVGLCWLIIVDTKQGLVLATLVMAHSLQVTIYKG
jgi:hypothetical protein